MFNFVPYYGYAFSQIEKFILVMSLILFCPLDYPVVGGSVMIFENRETQIR